MRFHYSLGALALAMASVPFNGGNAMAAEIKFSPANPVVEIQLSEMLETAPDMAIVTSGITTNGKTAKEAMDANNVRMQPMVAAVKAAGIDAKDIQTTGVRLGAEFDYSKSPARLKGYQASNSISITVRDLAKIDKVMAAMVNAGANEMNGPSFTLSNPDALASKARDILFDKAVTKAKAYAMKAGFKNVRLLSVTENADQSYAPMMNMEMAARSMDAGSAPPIEPGEVGVTVSAQFQFEMTP